MKRILVPTDFSTCADTALNFAVQASKSIPLEITALHVFEDTGSYYTDHAGLDLEFKAGLKADAEKKLKLLKTSIKETEGVDIDTVLRADKITEGIFHVAEEKAIDLIVMGTLGATGLKEKLRGSKTAAVIGKTRLPVMVIPYEYNWSPPARILLATSHFEENPRILNLVFELAGLFMAQVYVAVFTDEDSEDAKKFMEHGRKIAGYQQKLKETYKDDTLTTVHLSGHKFEDTLQEYIRKNDIDMLGMITYQRRFFDRLFHPDVTKRMAYHAEVPLLVIPAAET